MDIVMDNIVNIISGSCAVVAAIVAVYKMKQTKEKNIASFISQNRMKWIEEVRQNMYEFLISYINDEENGMMQSKAKIELYFRDGNVNYDKVITSMQKCIGSNYNEKDYDDLVHSCQSVLQDVWIRIKREAGVTKKMDKKIIKELYGDKKEEKKDSNAFQVITTIVTIFTLVATIYIGWYANSLDKRSKPISYEIERYSGRENDGFKNFFGTFEDATSGELINRFIVTPVLIKEGDVCGECKYLYISTFDTKGELDSKCIDYKNKFDQPYIDFRNYRCWISEGDNKNDLKLQFDADASVDKNKIFYLTFQGYADGIQQALIAVDFEEGEYEILQYVDSHDFEKVEGICKIMNQDRERIYNDIHRHFNELRSIIR